MRHISGVSRLALRSLGRDDTLIYNVGCPVHGEAFSRIPNHQPLDTSSTLYSPQLVMATKDVSGCDIRTVSWEEHVGKLSHFRACLLGLRV